MWVFAEAYAAKISVHFQKYVVKISFTLVGETAKDLKLGSAPIVCVCVGAPEIMALSPHVLFSCFPKLAAETTMNQPRGR